jgi:hypothetical protein
LSLPVLLVEADRSPSFAITGATNGSPCLITAPGHSFTNDQIVYINGIQGMGADINDRVFKVGTVNSPPGTLTLLNLDKTPYNATALSAYTGGGKVEKFEPFSLPGDSGSVVRDSSNKIVGLLFANNFGSPRKPEGFYAYVCHIADVMAAMKITVPVTSTMPGVQTAPANNNPYKHITRASATNAMAKLQNDLLDTEHGVVIARAMLAHEREVRALIRSNRRVAARWRHVSDPRLVDELIDSLFELDRPIVGAAPHDARRALNRFADQLARYGSKSLREDLARLRDPLIQMVDLTYREILAMLNTRTDVIQPELVDSQAPNEYAIDSAMKIESRSAAIAAFAKSQREVNAPIYTRNSGPDHTNSEAHR